jgi:hypothetical protein
VVWAWRGRWTYAAAGAVDLETGVGGQLIGGEIEDQRGVDTAGQIRFSSSS